MKKDPRLMDDEEKLAALAASGRMFSETPAPAADEDDGPEDKTPAPSDADPKPDPETPAASPNPDDKDDKDSKTQVDPALPPDPQNPAPRRNERYIPIAQYQDEKKVHKKTEEDLKIAQDELARIKSTNQPAAVNNQEAEAVIKAFGEKYSIDEDDVKKLLAVKGNQAALPEGFIETVQEMQREKADREEAEFFNTEWSPIENQLKEKYPNATQEQLKQAKDTLNKASHTEAYIDKDLDYVLFKNDADVSKIFGQPDPATPPADQPPVRRKTVESSRPAGSKVSLSAADFKDKTDFAEFQNMDRVEVNKIIKDMDPKTYRNYTTWVGKMENQGGLVVNRGGQKVVLK